MSNSYYEMGMEKAKRKDYAGAIEEFNFALQENPYFSLAYYQRGLAYYDSGAVIQGISDYTEAIKLDATCVEAYYARAIARLGLKNLPSALVDIDKVIALQPNHAGAYDLRGIIKRKTGIVHEAINNFKKAAELYLHQKDAENCRLCMEKIKQLQPKEISVPLTTSTFSTNSVPLESESEYFIQLIEKAEKGDIREAIEHLNWALKVDSQDGKAYCCRGVVNFKQGRYREALSDLNQALRFNFNDAIVYRNRGKVRLHLGDNQGAIADFNLALQIQPEDSLLYVARGNAYRSTGNYYGAIEDYNQALQMNPNDAQAYYNRGIAHTHIEEMQKAVDDYQRASSIYLEKEDWDSYQKVLDSLNKINNNKNETKQNRYAVLRQRLLRMVGGYWEIAERLIDEAKYHFPGMSEEWYVSKVIDELERDRGR